MQTRQTLTRCAVWGLLAWLLIGCGAAEPAFEEPEPVAEPTESATESPTVPPATAEPTSTTAPTSTVEPTATTEPTPTQEPTATREPEPAVTPTATTIPPDAIVAPTNTVPITDGENDTDASAFPHGDEAIAIVSQETGIPPEELTVVTQEEVTWRDSSLGCPQPGFNYLQVLTPGIRILVEGNNQTFHVHGDGANRLFLCENPQRPANP